MLDGISLPLDYFIEMAVMPVNTGLFEKSNTQDFTKLSVQDLGSCGQPCEFKSRYPHHKSTVSLIETVLLFFCSESPAFTRVLSKNTDDNTLAESFQQGCFLLVKNMLIW